MFLQLLLLKGRLLNYVPYVLVPYVLSCLKCLVPYVLSYPKCLVPHLPYALRALCHTCYCASRVSCLMLFRVYVYYVLLHFTCLVPCVFSGCSCLELYEFLCFSPLICFRCFLCISCLVAFMPCASCAFGALAI